VIYGERYAYTTGDGAGNPVLSREAPTALVNLYLLYRNVVMPASRSAPASTTLPTSAPGTSSRTTAVTRRCSGGP
jgi:hypothetical protein